MVNCDFEFPSNVKYPSIPCYVDKTTTVYPLKGTAFLTGPEFLLAKKNKQTKTNKKTTKTTKKQQKLDPIKNEMLLQNRFMESSRLSKL